MGNDRLQSKQPASRIPLRYLSRQGVNLLGLYHLVVGAGLAYLIYALWPRIVMVSGGEEVWGETLHLFFWPRDLLLKPEVRLLLVAMVCGAIGGVLHGIRSFADFAGNRQLKRSWLWWYIARIPVGSILAMICYFLVRGGFLTTSVDSTEINIYGIAAISTLAGLFSEDSVRKLTEVFQAILNLRDNREDKIDAPNENIAGASDESGKEQK